MTVSVLTLMIPERVSGVTYDPYWNHASDSNIIIIACNLSDGVGAYDPLCPRLVIGRTMCCLNVCMDLSWSVRAQHIHAFYSYTVVDITVF